ncbi:hypothetical protein ACIQUG_08210 [Ensifer sp. NPDC090286]|uniref:hypothetical protein n=1 Tax=Ensifer sp. NPDC090286 TaxID=3363991 RepID=UPI003839FF58
MEKDQDIVRTSLRLPKTLYDRIFEAAESRGVTMHAEILTRLTFAMDFDDKINEGPSELAEVLTKKLDTQEALMRETREEISIMKAWLRTEREKREASSEVPSPKSPGKDKR